MKILGLTPEDPYDLRSWSGSAQPFFLSLAQALKQSDDGSLIACQIRTNETLERLRVLDYSVNRWRARYHASVHRFEALTRAAEQQIAQLPECDAVLQIGAWFSSGAATDKPCYSYHDGNAAMRYRHYGRGLLSSRGQSTHLKWEQSVYNKLSRIFVMSEWLASSFMQDFGISSLKLNVVYAGVNFTWIPPVPVRSFERPRFLFVGTDFIRKGGKYLLEAFVQVRREVPSAELVIVGPKKLIDLPGVIWAGYLSKANVYDQRTLEGLFASATVMILPSIYEPFGISLAEGMIFGLPCIAVDRCAMPEIVRHGESGLIARAEDSDALARAMLDLAMDPARCAEYGRAGRIRAERDFTWKAVAGKIRESVLTDRDFVCRRGSVTGIDHTRQHSNDSEHRA